MFIVFILLQKVGFIILLIIFWFIFKNEWENKENKTHKQMSISPVEIYSNIGLKQISKKWNYNNDREIICVSKFQLYCNYMDQKGGKKENKEILREASAGKVCLSSVHDTRYLKRNIKNTENSLDGRTTRCLILISRIMTDEGVSVKQSHRRKWNSLLLDWHGS